MTAKWNEIPTPKGTLKWRYPDIAEGYDFLAAIKQITCAQDVFKIKGNFARMMGPMIDYSSLNYGSYDEFLTDRDNNIHAVTTIADLFFIEISKALAKKNLSAMPSTQHRPNLQKPSLLTLLKAMIGKGSLQPN